MTVKRKKFFLILFPIIIILAIGLIISKSPKKEILEGIIDTDEINITSKVTARVENIHVKEGDNVTLGELLVSMSDTQINEDARQAKEALLSAIANQDKANNGERNEYIESLKSIWISSKSDEENAKTSADRITKLYNNGKYVSAQQRDDAIAKYDIAKQKTNSTYEQYIQAKRGNREEDIRIADADVNAAKASLNSANSLVDELNVVSKNDGEISKRFVNQGEMISAGTPMLSMIDLDNTWVTINLREDRFNSLKKGDVLEGSIPSLNNKLVKFKVFFINPKASFATWRATRQSSGYDVRTFEIRLHPVDKVDGIRPGMTVIFNWPFEYD